MNMRLLVVTAAIALAITAPAARAGQHEGHEAAAGAAPATAQVAQCSQSQPVVTGLLAAALKRLEEARLTNSPSAMRDAADDVQSALVDVRTQLLPCAQMQAAGADANAGRIMPGMPGMTQPGTPVLQPGSPGPSAGAAAADPHTGHVMPAPASAAPATDPHAGHLVPGAPGPAAATAPARPRSTAAAPAAAVAPSEPAPPTKLAELKCTKSVDPKTAPRMLYQGRMYYFCSEQDRAEFAKSPGKYITAAPADAPAHAH